MKKYGFRFFVGLITFTIGLSFVSITISDELYYDKTMGSQHLNTVVSETPKSETVLVNYRGFEDDEFGKFAEIEVVNDTSKRIFYRSNTKGIHLHDKVSYRGGEGNFIGYCGNVAMRMQDFSLEPNERITFKVWLNRFWEYSSKHKKQDFRVGYDFKFEGTNEYETFWSNSFQLPVDIKKELLKN